MLTHHDRYYLQQEEPHQSCLIALKDFILSLDKAITPEWKYGLPFFYYKKKMFCYFWKDNKTNEPYIGIARGKEIEHPLLEKGNRKRIKIIRINPYEDLDLESLKEVFAAAMALY